MPASIRAVAADWASAPAPTQAKPKRQGRKLHAEQLGFHQHKNQRERQREQKTHMGRARRAQSANEIALHGVAGGLGGGCADRENRPGPVQHPCDKNGRQAKRRHKSPQGLTLSGAVANTNSALRQLAQPDSQMVRSIGQIMAVYTEVSDDELTAFLAGYDIGPLMSCKGIAEGVENSNFLLHTGAGYFILTLYEKRVAEEDLPFFLGLMDHLSGRGITCPRPVHDLNGQALGRLAGRAAVIVTFLDGMSVRRPDAKHCAMVGESLALLHRAGKGFEITRRNALSVDAWPALFRTAEARADGILPGLAVAVAQELSHLERNWPRDLPAGVIHADLFPDNVFFLSGQLSGLIDFYFACNDFLAYDIAICLNAWCFEQDASFNITKGMALLAGYQRVRKLTADEADCLPVLARGAALRFMLTRLVDWLNVPAGAMVRPKDPIEYVKKLRFHQHAASARDYGLLS